MCTEKPVTTLGHRTNFFSSKAWWISDRLKDIFKWSSSGYRSEAFGLALGGWQLAGNLFKPGHSEKVKVVAVIDMKIFDQVVAPYWKTNAAHVIEERIKEGERYKDQLRAAFDVEIATMKETDREETESQAQIESVQQGS